MKLTDSNIAIKISCLLDKMAILASHNHIPLRNRKSNIIVKFIFVVIFNVDLVVAANSTYGTALQKNLMDGYNKHVYPGRNYNIPLQVDVMFSLRTIKEFDEKMARFSVIGFFELYWNDERMTWESANYGNLNEAMFPQNNVWTPNFILQNSYSMINSLGMDKTPVRYTNDGSATWNPGDVFEISCDADVTYYPFDKQKCVIELVPYGYLKKEMTVTAMNNVINISNLSPNAIWDVIHGDIVVDDNRQQQYIKLGIVFKRRTGFYVVNVILPMILMCILNLIVFLEPFEEGGRVDYATTMLLTIAVFMTTVADTLPQSSLPMLPLLCYLVVSYMMISMAILVFTVIGLRFYHKDNGQPVPTWIANLVQVFLCKSRKCKKHRSRKQLEDESDDGKTWREYVTQRNYQIHKVHPENDERKQDENSGTVIKEDQENDTAALSWNDVGIAYDMFCLMFFVLLVLIINVLFLLTIWKNHEL